ncbi:hypothetical protein Tco_1012441 [Tanacetum coccineum]
MEILLVSSSNNTAVDYQDKDCQGRLLASFQDDAKYEHVGQDKRSQGGKDLKEKDLKISKLRTKSKDNKKAQDQRSHSMKEQAYNEDKVQDQVSRAQRQCNFKDLTSGEIVTEFLVSDMAPILVKGWLPVAAL